MEYKKILHRITIIFIAVLVFLTFFSRTLIDLQIPRVSLAFIQQGQIHPEATSSGIVTPADIERIFAPVSGRITQIIERGEDINDQTIIFTIRSDMQTLQDRLEQAEHDQILNTLEIERTISNITNAQQRLGQLQNQPLYLPTAPTLDLWEFDMQLETNAANIEDVESDIETLDLLFSQGVIPRQDIVNRESDLAGLIQLREEINIRRNRAIEDFYTEFENHEESVSLAQRNRTEQIQAQQNTITGYDFTLSTRNVERERIERLISDLREQIEGGGIVYVRLPENTPTNRTVTEIADELEVGAMVSEGSSVLTTAIRNNRFVIQARFPQSQDFIRPLQSVNIIIGTERMEGQVTRIIPEGGQNLVYIEVASNQLMGGELARVTVSGGITSHPNVIPLSALHEDIQGYYVLFITTQERRFGSDYFVNRMSVDVTRRDGRHVVISARFGMDLTEEPIIVNSDMPLSIGQRVRLTAIDNFVPAR